MRRHDTWGRPTRLGAFLTWARELLDDYQRCEVRRLARHELSGWETLQLLEARRDARP